MGFGLGVLRLAPAAFWSMTPAEIAAAFDAVAGAPGAGMPTRTDLDRLMTRFPDQAGRGSSRGV